MIITLISLSEKIKKKPSEKTPNPIMADRDRSRSPERGAPPADDAAADTAAPAPAADGGDAPAPAPADNNAAGAEGGSGDEVKLYVGNLDYGTFCNESQIP